MLEQKLQEYTKTDIYPFHMPGHKRQMEKPWNPYDMDITEIDGFDNLHQPREILLEVQKNAARIYGAKESFYLVNGSTCGILAAISATVSMGGKILVARNCHKSVYNGIFLRQLEAVYAYPEETRWGIQGQVTAETIEALLKENPDVEAVLITSPTYDGITSDIEKIAEVVHRYELPLIVDAAHGAHLGFVEDFPENPIHLGADIVVESVHKTLPAFTQTALLHVCSEQVSTKKIKKYLGIYETSSPSYILMAGIDSCMEYLEKDGKKDLEKLSKQLDSFYEEVKNLKNLKVLTKTDLDPEEAYDFDKSKILIFSKDKSVSGAMLSKMLLERYQLQMEMVSGQYVLALCSVKDRSEGFQRLTEALKEIDESAIFGKNTILVEKTTDFSSGKSSIYKIQKQFLPIYKAQEAKGLEVDFSEAVGKLAGEYIYLYPPGIPLIVPGEEITQQFLKDIEECEAAGLTVEGLSGKNRICIVNYS